jgi:uncharacterized membrane protein
VTKLEELLAALLLYGSWMASAVIGVGFAVSLAGVGQGLRIATLGIAMFILLPVLRVLVMFAVYLRERNLRFACIAGLVLVIILLGILSGSRSA